jgi:hypothetical protein
MNLSSRELKDFFVGMLLGDANIHNGAFSTRQISKDLIYFKYNIIKSYIPNCKIKITEQEAYIDKNNVNHQKCWYLYMSPCEYLKKLEKEFYPKGTKIVPVKYTRGLSPLGYAMWYADDGTTILVQYNQKTGSSKTRRVQLCTDNFQVNEVTDLLMPMIQREIGACSIVKRKPHQIRLQINGFDSQKFIQIIHDYFYKYFPSLLYKMDLGYRNESLENRVYVSKEYHELYLKISAHDLFLDRLVNRS